MQLLNFPIRLELEFQTCFRRDLQVRLAARSDRSARSTAGQSANRRARASARDASDDRSQACASQYFARRLLALAA